MTVAIDILGLLGLILTMVLSLFGGFAWVTTKLDKIKDAIASLDKTSVTHEQCSTKRRNCPCVKKIDELEGVLNNRS